VANVWDAMKKHEAEKAAARPPAAPLRQDAAPPILPEPPADEKVTDLIGPVSGNGYDASLVAHRDRGNPITEKYRELRTNLLASYPDQRFCMVVTSAQPGEGKTVTCLNLALVLAERQERRTIVVDCDLRKAKRRATDLLHIPNSPGLADVLKGAARLEAVTRPTRYRNLFVVPAGAVGPKEVGEVLHRPELEEAIHELRQRYDYVLIDAPPICIFSDAALVGRATGEALLVVRMNKTHRESVDRAVRLLHAANVKPAGIVLTHQKYYIPKYIYRYT